jgi:hypothetical protein
MSTAIELVTDEKRAELISKLVLKGDLSGLNDIERVRYYNMFCESLGLNPVTKPFDILNLGGKQVLYAKKDATEQLRKINGVSITGLSQQIQQDIIIVTANGRDKTGRTDAATGAVSIAGLKGDALANAIMKAETKAKRRLTLSICGLGILDESEIEPVITGRPTETNITQLPEQKDETPSAEDRRVIEADIGRLASMIGADALTAARGQLTNLRDMVKSKGITPEEYMAKLKAFKDELETKVAGAV